MDTKLFIGNLNGRRLENKKSSERERLIVRAPTHPDGNRQERRARMAMLTARMAELERLAKMKAQIARHKKARAQGLTPILPEFSKTPQPSMSQRFTHALRDIKDRLLGRDTP